jgi:hypothetical protein
MCKNNPSHGGSSVSLFGGPFPIHLAFLRFSAGKAGEFFVAIK